MSKMGFYSSVYLSILCLNFALISGQEKRIGLFDGMAQDNLKTVTPIESAKTDSIGSLVKGDKKFHEVLIDTFRNQRNLNPADKRRFVFTLLSHYEAQHPIDQPTVLDITSRQDLEMLSGPKSNLSHYLAAKVDRTSTEVGRVIFFKRFICPTQNVEILQNHQTIIKELYTNDELFTAMDNALTKLQAAENIMLSFWEEDIFQSILKQDAFNIPFAPKLSEWANKSPKVIEFSNCTRLISLLGANLYMSIGAISLPLMGVATLTDSPSLPAIKNFNDTWGLGAMSILSATGLSFYLYKQYHNSKTAEGVSHIVGGPIAAMNVLYIPDHLRGVFTFKKCIQAKLIHAASYINSLKAISVGAKKNAVLEKTFPLITQLDEELKKLSERSKEIKQLLALLETSTFKGKPHALSLYGRMYVAYNLLHKVKNELVDAMIAAGELDAYMSCARLLKEFDDKRVQFCFPKYLTNNTKPSIEIYNFWNPAINNKIAVTNSIIIGGPEHKQNVIVTGPNAGGKSTTMKGLIISIIMAQSLGIAPAQALTFTPFTKIMTYLNITDDIAAGNSHFKAGVLRALDLITVAKEQTGTNFSFTAVDEVFNGTTHEEGQAAAYALIEELGRCSNNVCVTVTHFPKVPLLEERTNNFTNYKVTVLQTRNTKIQYPYRLERGISNQTIALDILKQEGFGDTFLTKAQEILKETH